MKGYSNSSEVLQGAKVPDRHILGRRVKLQCSRWLSLQGAKVSDRHILGSRVKPRCSWGLPLHECEKNPKVDRCLCTYLCWLTAFSHYHSWKSVPQLSQHWSVLEDFLISFTLNQRGCLPAWCRSANAHVNGFTGTAVTLAASSEG